jgi:hypothetical protein
MPKGLEANEAANPKLEARMLKRIMAETIGFQNVNIR